MTSPPGGSENPTPKYEQEPLPDKNLIIGIGDNMNENETTENTDTQTATDPGPYNALGNFPQFEPTPTVIAAFEQSVIFLTEVVQNEGYPIDDRVEAASVIVRNFGYLPGIATREVGETDVVEDAGETTS